MKDMCRACMIEFSKKEENNNKNQSIHEVPAGCKSNISIKELLQLVQPQIKIEMEDNLPTLMCSDCVQKLLMSHEFIEMYKSVDIKLRKMLKEVKEVSNCNYDFNDIDDQSLTTIQENYYTALIDREKEIFEITRLEIEQIRIESFKEEEENEWPEFVNQTLQELTEEAEYNDTFLSNPYSDASDNESTPHQSCEKTFSNEDVTQKRNSDHKMNDGTINSTSIKLSGKKISKKRKKVKEKVPLPVENSNGSVSCQHCVSVFDNIKLFEEHMEQHLLEKIAEENLRKKSDKLRKIELNQRNHKCEKCGKGFANISYYKNHMCVHSDPHLCIVCGKSFKKLNNFKTHMLRHKGEKTYQCQHCPKRFVCSSGLYGHMMMHKKEKPYVCDICGIAFHMPCQLRKHNLYHNGIKNYKCEYCDMRFVTRETQRRHMRTHTGEKSYRCKYCERGFAQSNDCVKHLRLHLGDNVYQCELCPLRFPLARDLRGHFATHKDDDEETRARNLEARMEEERNLQNKFGSKKT